MKTEEKNLQKQIEELIAEKSRKKDSNENPEEKRKNFDL